MNRQKSKRPSSFIIKESKALNAFACIIFTAMFFSALYYDLFNKEATADIRIAYLTIVPAIYFLKKIFNNQVFMEINSIGIYYQGSLLTNWNNFISANYTQEEKMLSLQDNFVLLLEYKKQVSGQVMVSKIALPSTINKAEEDIIAAIKEYCPNCMK